MPGGMPNLNELRRSGVLPPLNAPSTNTPQQNEQLRANELTGGGNSYDYGIRTYGDTFKNYFDTGGSGNAAFDQLINSDPTVSQSFNANRSTSLTNDAIKEGEGLYQADVGEFNRMIPQARGKLLGNLASRGLGASLGTGGLGTSDLNEFGTAQSKTLGEMEAAQKKFSGDLGLQNQARQNAINNFLMNYNLMDQNTRGSGAGVGDFLGLGANIGRGLMGMGAFG